MNWFFISYELTCPDANGDRLFGRLRQLEADGVLPTSWTLNTALSEDDLYHDLLAHMDPSDRLWVGRITTCKYQNLIDADCRRM